MHTIRFMTMAVAAAAAVLMVASCDQTQAIDGKYKGVMPILLGLDHIEVPLEISGKTAVMDSPSTGRRMDLKVTRDGDRLFIYEQKPDDGLTFDITNNGNTLVCSHCKALGFPTDWERQL